MNGLRDDMVEPLKLNKMIKRETAKIALCLSLWFFLVVFLWRFGFFLDWRNFARLFHHVWGFPILILLLLLPGANILALGWFKQFALSMVEGKSTGGDFPRLSGVLFSLGLETSGLCVGVFSPTLICLAFSGLQFLLLAHAGPGRSLEHSMSALFFLILAAIFFLISWALFPVCFFRHLEDKSFRWALSPSGAARDFFALGAPFWQSLIFLMGLELFGALGLLGVAALLAASPLGMLVSGFLLVYGMMLLFTEAAVFGIRSWIGPFMDLHYEY